MGRSVYLYSKAWVVQTLKEMGGEAPLELLRELSAGSYKYKVLDCFVPEYVNGKLSCIEEALESLKYEGVIEIKDGKVRLVGDLKPSLILK